MAEAAILGDKEEGEELRVSFWIPWLAVRGDGRLSMTPLDLKVEGVGEGDIERNAIVGVEPVGIMSEDVAMVACSTAGLFGSAVTGLSFS